MSRAKKFLITASVFVGAFVIVAVTYIVLKLLDLLESNAISLPLSIAVFVVGAFAVTFTSFFYVAHRQDREIVKENDYAIHRKNHFYNYNLFARYLNLDTIRNRNARGYLLVFNAIRAGINTSYSASKTADFNGYISDYIVKVGNSMNTSGISKDFSYCFYRGNFVFYIKCDEAKLNKFIQDLENEVYRISAEYDFRLYVQPSFGIYEHIEGAPDSVYDMTNKATIAREIAEKNFETAVFYSEEMLSSKENDEADEISAALDNGEFVVYYQPKFNLYSKRFTSSEALVRWNSPTRGLLSPMRFINTAENSGLIHKIDMYVFEQVCKDLDETRRKGRRLVPASINFSLYEFYSPSFVDDIIGMMEKYNISPTLIEIEILEGTTGVNLFLSISILKRLKEYGIRILMDDFGVGYSNFNNLKNLPIDVIKIDKSFIDNIADDVKSREIAKFMIEFSKEIGLEVIAEGVDNQKQVDILKKFRCDTIQGFYYSKALPRADFEKFIAMNPFEKKGA